MGIDKMECNAIWLPTKWSLLNTPFFKDGHRIQVALIGSWWAGLKASAPIHIRTVFDDIPETGSVMQFSCFMLNLHEKAIAEGRLPEEWVIGVDNTPKETKNRFVLWGLVWLLCALNDSPLWSITLCFLLVGHTHDAIDRFFSRVKVALAGHDYYTMQQMIALLTQGLPGFRFSCSHLVRVWNWKGLGRFDIPPMKGMARCHAISLFRQNGIYVKWKQYMTSEH